MSLLTQIETIAKASENLIEHSYNINDSNSRGILVSLILIELFAFAAAFVWLFRYFLNYQKETQNTFLSYQKETQNKFDEIINKQDDFNKEMKNAMTKMGDDMGDALKEMTKAMESDDKKWDFFMDAFRTMKNDSK